MVGSELVGNAVDGVGRRWRLGVEAAGVDGVEHPLEDLADVFLGQIVASGCGRFMSRPPRVFLRWWRAPLRLRPKSLSRQRQWPGVNA